MIQLERYWNIIHGRYMQSVCLEEKYISDILTDFKKSDGLKYLYFDKDNEPYVTILNEEDLYKKYESKEYPQTDLIKSFEDYMYYSCMLALNEMGLKKEEIIPLVKNVYKM